MIPTLQETRIQFSQNVKDLANKMIEKTRAIFSQWRDREGEWIMSLGELLPRLAIRGVLLYEHIPELVAVRTSLSIISIESLQMCRKGQQKQK